MARTALATQPVVLAGLNPAYTAANVDGHSLDGDGDVILHVKNGGGAPITVTVVTGATLEGEPVADRVVSVPAAGERIIGRFRSSVFNDPTDGTVHVDFSAVTSVTVAAFGV